MHQTTHRIYIGDSRRMDDLADESIHLVVTSPPYWQLKDYGHSNQIGFNDSYEQYINHLNLVWAECDRVLKPGCRLCVNIGDQFARSVYYGRYKVIPIRTEIIKFCEAVGLDYMGAIIWQKVTTTNTTGGASVMGSFPYPRNGILKLDYEFILIFKKNGTTDAPTKEAREASKLTTAEWNEFFAGHWRFPGERQSSHIAMFPKELPRRLIRMFSFIGETILDPFLGSGTTSVAALETERNSVGYEIDSETIPLLRSKLRIDQASTLHTTTIQVKTDSPPDLDQRLGRLPYVFKDLVRINRKLDPRKLSFGSKISRTDQISRDNYLKIKTIVSPDTLLLNSDQPVKLLGVRISEANAARAVQYLRDRVAGETIYLRFDANVFSPTGDLLAYVYLKNRTFVNAHLIRSGLVEVDVNSEYRMKSRFLQIAGARNG